MKHSNSQHGFLKFNFLFTSKIKFKTPIISLTWVGYCKHMTVNNGKPRSLKLTGVHRSLGGWTLALAALAALGCWLRWPYDRWSRPLYDRWSQPLSHRQQLADHHRGQSQHSLISWLQKSRRLFLFTNSADYYKGIVPHY